MAASAQPMDGFHFNVTRYDQKLNANVDHYTKEEKRAGYWSDLNVLNLSYPLGYTVNGSKDLDRVQEYFPVISFMLGYSSMKKAAEIFTDYVIQYDMQRKLSESPTQQNIRGKSPLLQKHTVINIELTYSQRFALGFLCIANYIRGLVTICQLGVLFMPFDVITNLIQNQFKKA